MHLIEILLPIAENEGQRFDARKDEEVRQDLSRRFGRITTFTRAPAHGTSEGAGEIVHDDFVVFEVMTDTLDRAWWKTYRRRLETSFSQDEIVVRAVAITRL